MTRKLFGTDGVRGRANSWPMTAELALKLGAAAGRYFRRDGSAAHRVVIGKDTRLSGYMFETALASGIVAMGAAHDVLFREGWTSAAVEQVARATQDSALASSLTAVQASANAGTASGAIKLEAVAAPPRMA